MPQTYFDDGQMGYEMKHIQGTRNIVQNTYTPKLETVGVNTQTQNPNHMKYTQTPDMYRDNTSTQTQPIQHFEAGTNTNLASNRFSQTQQRNVNTQSTNTPSQNCLSTHNYSCNCEDGKMDHTGILYRTNFARQLQQSEAIPNVQLVTNYDSERPRQTESSTIYHIPQESISHTQPPSLQYTQQPITKYNSESPRQTESSTIY